MPRPISPSVDELPHLNAWDIQVVAHEECHLRAAHSGEATPVGERDAADRMAGSIQDVPFGTCIEPARGELRHPDSAEVVQRHASPCRPLRWDHVWREYHFLEDLGEVWASPEIEVDLPDPDADGLDIFLADPSVPAHPPDLAKVFER